MPEENHIYHEIVFEEIEFENTEFENFDGSIRIELRGKTNYIYYEDRDIKSRKQIAGVIIAYPLLPIIIFVIDMVINGKNTGIWDWERLISVSLIFTLVSIISFLLLRKSGYRDFVNTITLEGIGFALSSLAIQSSQFSWIFRLVLVLSPIAFLYFWYVEHKKISTLKNKTFDFYQQKIQQLISKMDTEN